MNEQEIVVGIVMLVCLVWVIRRTILCFNRIKKKNNPCDGCPCGCKTSHKTCPSEKK